MNLNLDRIVDKPISVRDAIAAEQMIVDDLLAANEALALCISMDQALVNLRNIGVSIEQYGWTPQLQGLFGQELKEYGIEASAEGIAGAVGKGIAAFARALGTLITKIIKLAMSFFSKDRKSVLGAISALETKIGSIQNTRNDYNGPTKAQVISYCNTIKKHFGVDYKSLVPGNQGENVEINALRTMCLKAFNSKVGSDAEVTPEYKLKHPLAFKDGKIFREYGYASMTDVKAADSALQEAMKAGEGVISKLKSSGEEVSRIVKLAESNKFSKDGGESAELQCAFVYTRIIFNDISALRSLNNSFAGLLAKAEAAAKKFVTTAKEPTKNENEDKAMDIDTTPDNQK